MVVPAAIPAGAAYPSELAEAARARRAIRARTPAPERAARVPALPLPQVLRPAHRLLRHQPLRLPAASKFYPQRRKQAAICMAFALLLLPRVTSLAPVIDWNSAADCFHLCRSGILA